MSINAASRMHNGATVADWLGTAATSAKLAASWLDNMREGHGRAEDFEVIEDRLQQALNEVREVRSHVASWSPLDPAPEGWDGSEPLT